MRKVRLRWIAFAGCLFVLAGCGRECRRLESGSGTHAATPVASTSSSATAAEPVPPGDLHCLGNACDLTFVTETAAQTLAARPDRDSLQIRFRDNTTPAGFASLRLIPWVTAVIVGGPIDDLTPIASSSRITSLHILDASRIDSIAALGKLQDLHDLQMFQVSAGLTDLSPLEALRRLTTLKMTGDRYDTLLTRPSLELRGIHPASWDFLASMHSLSQVTLANTGIPGVDVLAGVRQLRFLALTDEKVPTLAPLASLPGLISVRLYTSSIGDKDAVSLLERLDDLLFSSPYPGEVSIPAIAKLTSLESLHISDDLDLRDIAPLTALVNMKTLHLIKDPGVTRIDALRAMPNLREVDLDGTRVSSLGPLAGARQMTFLDVDDTPVASLAPLVGDPDLRNVIVGKTFPKGAIAAFSSKSPHVTIRQAQF